MDHLGWAKKTYDILFAQGSDVATDTSRRFCDELIKSIEDLIGKNLEAEDGLLEIERRMLTLQKDNDVLDRSWTETVKSQETLKKELEASQRLLIEVGNRLNEYEKRQQDNAVSFAKPALCSSQHHTSTAYEPIDMEAQINEMEKILASGALDGGVLDETPVITTPKKRGSRKKEMPESNIKGDSIQIKDAPAESINALPSLSNKPFIKQTEAITETLISKLTDSFKDTNIKRYLHRFHTLEGNIELSLTKMLETYDFSVGQKIETQMIPISRGRTLAFTHHNPIEGERSIFSFGLRDNKGALSPENIFPLVRTAYLYKALAFEGSADPIYYCRKIVAALKKALQSSKIELPIVKINNMEFWLLPTVQEIIKIKEELYKA